jgi:MFS family permease
MKLPGFLGRWIAKLRRPAPPKQEPTPPAEDTGEGQISKQTLALILSPLGILLISAARLIIVSDYNTTTAVTIASSGGYVNALLGSIIPLVPVFAPYIALLLLLFRRFLLSLIAFIFTAFITPAPVKLSDMLPLASAESQLLFGHVAAASHVTPTQVITFVALLVIIGIFWVYHRSLGEAVSIVIVMAVAFVLLLARPNQNPSMPRTLRLAGMGEHELVAWSATEWTLIILIGLMIVYFLTAYYQTFPKVLSVIIAIIATLALFPYVYNVYPFPRHTDYYVKVLHELWLPAEKIVLKSGVVYSGYVLSNSDGWFTLLRANKTIIYLQADNVIRRSVCQPRTNPKPPSYSPLVSLLYSKPPPTPACPPRDISVMLTSFRSRGEPLRKISMTVHRCPWTIISVTNAHEHEEPSAALRAYESARDWNKPTPAGQRFWYYPRVGPGHHTCPAANLSW